MIYYSCYLPSFYPSRLERLIRFVIPTIRNAKNIYIYGTVVNINSIFELMLVRRLLILCIMNGIGLSTDPFGIPVLYFRSDAKASIADCQQ